MRKTEDGSSDRDLEPILSALVDGVPGHLNVEARCRLVQRIVSSILRRAKQHNLYTYDENGLPDGFRAGYFNTEDIVLEKLVATLSYTQHYADFFDKNAVALGKAMAGIIPAEKFRREWAEWDVKKRFAFLRDLAESQCRLFNHDTLTFSPPPLRIAPLSSSIRGQFNAGAWPLSALTEDKEISIAKAHLDNSDVLAVVQTVWHEHTHSLCQQFAAARDSGLLPDYNPFARDAETSRQRQKYNAFVPSALTRAYAADPEENLAFSTQKLFTAVWEENSSLLSRTKAALRRLLP